MHMAFFITKPNTLNIESNEFVLTYTCRKFLRFKLIERVQKNQDADDIMSLVLAYS